MPEIFNVCYQGCGHKCPYDPNKHPEGRLILDSTAAVYRQCNNKDVKNEVARELDEPIDRTLPSPSPQSKTSRSSSLYTMNSREEKSVIIATQPLCPECFNVDEDRICEAYAKRVNVAIKDCDISGLTESEVLQVCKIMEAEHENELQDFHDSSGYKDTGEKAAGPIVKTETLRGFLAIAETECTKRNVPRCAPPVSLKKADVGSDYLTQARAEWGGPRSATPGSTEKVWKHKDFLAIARPRRDGTRFAFPVRVPKTKLNKEIEAI